MSLLIKGMEMPKEGCKDCPFAVRLKGFASHTCAVNGKLVAGNHERGGFPCDCLLLPVPPHGDLIDRDAAAEKIWDDMKFPSNLANAQFYVNELREMPTVIPAEEAKP